MTARGFVTLPWFVLAVFALSVFVGQSVADEKPKKKPEFIVLGDVKMTAPEGWVKKQPKSRILAYEFAAKPKPDKNKKEKSDSKLADGRFTVMRATGGIKANVQRWFGQFSQPDGRNTKDVAKVTEKEFGKSKVHLVDISGTFNDRPRPFGPQVIKRKDYRMLAAIIPTGGGGGVFLKFYGPKPVVTQHEKAFMKMLESLSVGK